MFTRCTGCEAVYDIRPSHLATAAGMVRCGRCGKTFNALNNLFDQRPAPGAKPLPGSGMPPMLEDYAVEQTRLPGLDDDNDSDGEEGEEAAADSLPDNTETEEADTTPAVNADSATGSARSRWWPLTCLVLGLGLIGQLALAPPERIASLWEGSPGEASLLAADELIQVVSRDLHPHPTLNDAVVVSLTLRNRSQRTLPLPVIELRLYDASQQVIGARRLVPSDYIDDPDMISRGLPQNLLMPVILELVVGTTPPSGFELRFLPVTA